MWTRTRVIGRTLLNAVTVTGAGASVTGNSARTTFQAVGVMSSGTGSATVKIQVSNNNSQWDDAGVISLTLTTSPSSGIFVLNAPWVYVRGNVSALSANGTVSLYMGSA